MAEEKLFKRPELPDKSDPGYIDALVDACIMVFERFGDDSMSLNYMGVTSKLRPIVLSNERYKDETRKIQAEKFLQEIEEIEEISKELGKKMPRQSEYDIRNPKDAEKYEKDIKETLSLRLKVADMRREILSINKTKENEENDALNIFFIPLTAEEFAAMPNTEIHEGSDDTDMSSGDDKEKIKKTQTGADIDNTPPPFVIGPDGAITEVQRK